MQTFATSTVPIDVLRGSRGVDEEAAMYDRAPVIDERGAAVRLAIFFVAFFIFIAAGYLSPTAKPAQYFNAGSVVTGVLLTAALALQHSAQVARLFNAPSKKRRQLEESARTLAQATLKNLVQGKRITDDRLGMMVHVWIVPVWYRTFAPFRLRLLLRRLVTRPRFARFGRWAFRPTLLRLAAVGLVKRNSSHVSFTKGRGLVGLCLSKNDEDLILSIDLRDPAARAQLQLSEADWAAQDLEVTRGLTLDEATRLARRYGQVIGCVIQSPAGEALGCATISVPEGASINLGDPYFAQELHELASSVANILV